MKMFFTVMFSHLDAIPEYLGEAYSSWNDLFI